MTEDEALLDIDALSRELASLTGETQEEAVRTSLTERLEQLRSTGLATDLIAVVRRCDSSPTRDHRTTDEISHNEDDLPR